MKCFLIFVRNVFEVAFEFRDLVIVVLLVSGHRLGNSLQVSPSRTTDGNNSWG